jgi:hypothetical protein
VKKLFFVLQFFLFLAFNFFLLIAAYQLKSPPSTVYSPDNNNVPHYISKEDFDPSLLRLNTINKFVVYCDSLYKEKSYTGSAKFEEIYPQITSEAVRNRFYHGYSFYNPSNNFMAVLLSAVSIKGLSAIVIPDDILKYPYAACSQQSIVMMEILRRKGFPMRIVEFQGKRAGHFCFEVYYNGGWHFCDPDMEPDTDVLNAYNRPGIEFLVRHQDILLKAYHQYPAEKVLDIFPNYSYRAINSFAAPRAIIFQQMTKFLSYTIWLFFLISFILVRKNYLRLSGLYVRNNRIHIARAQPGTSPNYYPDYSA